VDLPHPYWSAEEFSLLAGLTRIVFGVEVLTPGEECIFSGLLSSLDSLPA